MFIPGGGLTTYLHPRPRIYIPGPLSRYARTWTPSGYVMKTQTLGNAKNAQTSKVVTNCERKFTKFDDDFSS